MTVPVYITVPVAVLLSVALILTLTRILRGPTMLDRVVALEVLLAVIVCGLGVQAAVTGDATYVPVLIALSLLGFVGSSTIARFTHREDGSRHPEKEAQP